MADSTRISPQPWLDQLARRLGSPFLLCDEDAVHQLRVAAGRLGVWLELGGRRALRDDLRRLRREVASLRDADVLIARRNGGVEIPSLARARAEECQRISTRLQASKPEALLRALDFVPWLVTSEAERVLARLAARVVSAGDAFLCGEHDSSRIHRFRRRVRRARYALEWLGRDATQSHELQDVLGAWHDVELELGRCSETAADGARNALRRETEALLERAGQVYATHRNRWCDVVECGGRAWTSS